MCSVNSVLYCMCAWRVVACRVVWAHHRARSIPVGAVAAPQWLLSGGGGGGRRARRQVESSSSRATRTTEQLSGGAARRGATRRKRAARRIYSFVYCTRTVSIRHVHLLVHRQQDTTRTSRRAVPCRAVRCARTRHSSAACSLLSSALPFRALPCGAALPRHRNSSAIRAHIAICKCAVCTRDITYCMYSMCRRLCSIPIHCIALRCVAMDCPPGSLSEH